MVYSQGRPDALASYRAGRDAENTGKSEEASAKYNEAVRICMDEINNKTANMDTYTVLTWTLQRQKKYKDVILRGSEALKSGNDPRILETMGEAYFYLGSFESSLNAMQRYVTLSPEGDRVSVAYFFMGEIYRYQKKYNYADIAYTMAVKLSPELALWWYRLGSVRESAGNRQYALNAYDQALRLDPGYAAVKEAVARLRQTA
jgi:tetratricopeptide (TPR) repeat protein